MSKLLSDYIQVYDNALTVEQCEHYINLFQQGNIFEGSTYVQEGYKEINKVSLDVSLSEDFPEEVNKILELLVKHYVEYSEIVKTEGLILTSVEHICIRKYQKDKGVFEIHQDGCVSEGKQRVLTFIVCLNSVEQGGVLRFPDLDLEIKSEPGKLIIFPAAWMFMHELTTPCSNDRYILRTFGLTQPPHSSNDIKH